MVQQQLRISFATVLVMVLQQPCNNFESVLQQV